MSSTQFGNGVPLNYALTSQQGSVAVATSADVAGSNLTLTSNAAAGAGGVNIGAGTTASFSLISLSVNASAGNSIQLNSTPTAMIGTTGTVGSTTNGMIFNGAIALSHDTTLISNNGGGVDFAALPPHGSLTQS